MYNRLRCNVFEYASLWHIRESKDHCIIKASLTKNAAVHEKAERRHFYEKQSCMEGSRFLTLQINLWRKENGKSNSFYSN